MGGGSRYKHLIYTMFVIGLILLVVGVSYAAYRFSGTGTTENVITTGNLEVSFEEQNNILIKDRYPETDTEGLANTDEDSSMSFTVSSNIVGTATVNYAVGLVEIQEGTTLTQDYIKINLTKNGIAATGFNATTGKTIKSFQNETFGELLTSHVITRGSITGTNVDTYNLKAWIDENYNLPKTDTSSGNSHSVTTTSEEFSFKIKVAGTDATINEEEEQNIPNAPELATNMIPVVYSEDEDTWVKADSTNANNSWYNYDNKVWANAVTVTEVDNSRSDLVDAPVGTPIPMERINTMWVWIPRFSATMGSIDCSTVTGGTYEEYPMCYDLTLTTEQQTAIMECFGVDESTVQALLDGETVDGLDLEGVIELYNTQVAPDNPIVPDTEFNSSLRGNTKSFEIKFTTTSETSHDAFTFGDDNIAGFWMAKFEPSHQSLESNYDNSNNLACTNDTCENAKGIEILPNKTSLRWNNVSNFFYAGRSLEQAENNYGLVSNEIDTHMMKNSEWGAVAYLSQSIYGRCTSQLECTEIGINNNSSYVTGYGAPAGSSAYKEDSQTYVVPQSYNTLQGMDASTTGNIYGVYDMSGGANEYVMGLYKPEVLDGIRDYSEFSTETSNSQYDKLTIETKYYDVYTTSEAYDNAGLQHAVNETVGWYLDYFAFVSDEFPWFSRGTNYSFETSAGIFAVFERKEGMAGGDFSFRPVLIK